MRPFVWSAYVFFTVTLSGRYYSPVIPLEGGGQRTTRLSALSVVAKPGRGSSGIQTQAHRSHSPLLLPRHHKQPSGEAKFDNCQIKPHALKRYKKGAPASHPPLLPAPLIGTKLHLPVLCTSREESHSLSPARAKCLQVSEEC